MWRLVLLLVVAGGLAPGTWVRSALPPADYHQELTMTRLPVPSVRLGEFMLEGAWQLTSPNHHFGGQSTLVVLDDGALLSASDAGRRLRFYPPGHPRKGVELSHFVERGNDDKRLADAEALTRDPATGRLWAAYEHDNLIERYDATLRPEGRVYPPQMRDWPSNAGPEAMVRLADGRFIVLAEDRPEWFGRGHPGLLFPGDPVDGAEPVEFAFEAPPGFKPVDMACLPDGRVLVLARAIDWQLPPKFRARLLVADPAAIAPGATWRGREVADLAQAPSDNFEGLAVDAATGEVVVWVISDDNRASFQRTLLLKLVWRPDEKSAQNEPRASLLRR